ncbi:unnamed protein product [Rotaria sp. Silwood2]|nr:unnamed protein product [Rotaria sp. Silwood2]
MYSSDNQYTLTTAQPSYHPEALTDGHLMRWPRFGIKEAIFRGRSYTLTNTCPTDSALFALYFIYKIDINIAGELNDAPETSAYSTLVKTFRTVEKEGWDAARLSWLHEHGILQHVAEKKSLFGSADKQVFRFLTCEQQHSSQIECSRVQCKKRRRNRTNTELCLFTFEDYIRDFNNETTDACDIMMARSDEITTEEAREYKYRSVTMLTTDGQPDEHAWVCNATAHVSVATFTHSHPPIIIVNIRYLPKNKKGSDDDCPQLLDLKREIKINSIKFIVIMSSTSNMKFQTKTPPPPLFLITPPHLLSPPPLFLITPPHLLSPPPLFLITPPHLLSPPPKILLIKLKWSWVTIKSPAEYERRRRGTNEEVTSNENSPRIEEVYNSIDSIV